VDAEDWCGNTPNNLALLGSHVGISQLLRENGGVSI
jgi:hypothetical protein